MSAKLLRAVFCVACGSLMFAGSGQTTVAAPGAPTSPATGANAKAPERLTREDVDQLLVKAQAAIKEGNLEQADALVARAEKANIHYNFMYMGLQPASVRRELAKAQKARGPVARSTAAKAGAGTTRPPERGTSLDDGINSAARGMSEPVDALTSPYSSPGTRSAFNDASNMPLPSAASNRGDTTAQSTYLATDAPSTGGTVANPFTAGGATAAGGRYGDARNGDSAAATGGVMQTAYGDGPVLSGPARYDATPAAGVGDNWSLPNGQTPANSTANRAYTPDLRQPGDTSPAPSRKEQVSSRLIAARQAMDAGNLDMAAKLTREASQLGVPESQFLPHEDRPSLVAGDIARAQQAGHGAPARQQASRADLNTPLGAIGASRYPADQAGPAVNPLSPNTGRSTPGTALPPIGSEPRVALTPDPLQLPNDSERSFSYGLGQMAGDLPTANTAAGDAASLLRDGEAAMRNRDRQGAMRAFTQAYAVKDQLTQTDQQRLREHLQMLQGSPADNSVAGASPRRLAAAPRDAVTTQGEMPIGPGEPLGRPGDLGAGQGPTRLPGLIETPEQLSATPLPSQGAGRGYNGGGSNMLDAANSQSQVLARQLQTEVGRSQTEARRLIEIDPKQALDVLKATRQKVTDAPITDDVRSQLLKRLDVTQDQTQHYVDEHKAEIQLDQQNKAVLADVDRGRETKLKVQQKTAELVNEFNKLRDEQRYQEMEVVARRLYEMSPDEPIAQQVWIESKFIRRTILNRQVADLKEDSFIKQMHATNVASVNNVAEDGHEVDYDKHYWGQFVKDRKGTGELGRRNEREIEINRRLDTPVRLRYQNTPLTQVVDEMSQLAGINIHLDPRGLSQEGLESDQPITINLNSDISLKSALRLVLTPLHLSYVIKDEVLQITSEQISKGDLVIKPYSVADLVIPIPNFVPSADSGLQALINNAYAAELRGQNGIGGNGARVLVGERGSIPGSVGANGNVLANQVANGRMPGFGPSAAGNTLSPNAMPIGSGPGGMGGGANADFDSLIDLIVATVAPESWAESGGGTAEVRSFPTNLSLVISQTQAVHQEIADLLEQLRRLQDLQVTIECRFIRLNDSFFERIGIDFDVNIEDRTIGTADLVPGTPFEGRRQTATVGISTPTGLNDFPRFTSDLDVPFRQNSFELTRLPPFGSPADVANFGFAILSDIEAYFLIEAAQGDRRTNVLNAPKVTLFNGQLANVQDTNNQPFVIGVVPVVGEFVAAQQPVIVVLNEGTMMSIQAVVSDDRRYVRLTVVPYFTQIGDVDTFTFEGSSSSTSSSSTTDDDNNGKNEKSDKKDDKAFSGTTVQLPSFSTITVSTTVSVPDGGTVLLGGIKRLSEGRNEFGVPLLSKLPYVNRLFKNVAIGRETDSLMMMVTPRIIIQEEEEERLGIVNP